MVSGPESCDTRLRESQVFRGGETKRQEWYCECSGDRYHDSGAEVEDTSQERWTRHAGNPNGSRSRDTGIRPWRSGRKCYRLIWAQTRERARTELFVQGEQRSQELETMSRGTLLDAVKDAIFTERSPSTIRTERADRVDLLAVGWKGGPVQTGGTPVDAVTRNGKDTENEKGERVEGYCGHCETGSTDKRVVCWSRQVCRAETDTAELQDVDPTSKQTPVPVAAPRRISNTGLPDEQRNDGRIRTIPSQSAYHAQQEFGDRTSF